MHQLLKRALVSVAACAGVAGSQTVQGCTYAGLPAYSHNDYENSRPLSEAIEHGFRGAEADVFLVDGALRVGHDRRAAQLGGDFEELYLKPLRELVSRCRTLTVDGTPFFLAVELKENSPAAYTRLLATLHRYPDLLTLSNGGTADQQSPVEVILVGWHPPLAALQQDRDGLIRIQQRLARPQDSHSIRPNVWVRLYSVDYGKTFGRRGMPVAQRRLWLEALRQVKSAAPQARVRVHNVPPDDALYSALLECGGVDLIGTKDLRKTKRLLASYHSGESRRPAQSVDRRMETSGAQPSLAESCT